MGKVSQYKKMKQAGRRQARADLERYLKSFEEHLRPKPKWVPERVWRWGQRIFIRYEDR